MITLRTARRAFITVTSTLAALLVGIVAWMLTPPDDALFEQPVALGVTVTDRDGVTLRDTRAPGGERWRWVSLADMDPVLTAAFIAAEDRTFFEHDGVAWRSVARAARDNLVAGRVVSGASTITMQTARLLHGHSRGLIGKTQQVLWAMRLERHVSKDHILEQYLNRVPLGQGAIGVEAASRLYFGAASARLGPGRAATLAGIARSPARDNPLRDPARAAARRDVVLGALASRGQISESERALASTEPAIPVASSRVSSFRAPHFTTRVLSLLEIEGGAGNRNVLRTTLDIALQEQVERDVRQVVQSLTTQRVQHAAALVLDNATGDVLAWVGSPDFFGDRGQVDMVTSRRQPGSALKPFLYAHAFERGFTAASVLDDIPRTWMTSTGPYAPRNYDRQFRGPVRARVALASSLNVPAVQLAGELGTTALLDVLHRAGFASLTRSADHYGLGLALGNGEVTLLELTNAYRALARGGVFAPATLLQQDAAITTPHLSRTKHAPTGSRVVAEDVAALTLDILADRDARLAGFGDAAVFDFGFPVAVKTGTSRHFTDNWAVAVTGSFTVGVWVGNFDGTPMAAVSGIAGAGPLLRRVVLATSQRRPPGLLVSPGELGAHRIRVCRVSGMAAVPACDAVSEWQLASAASPMSDDWHRDGAIVLPSRFAAWERAQAQRSFASATGLPVRSQLDAQPLALLSPRDGDVYVLPTGPARDVATIALRATGAGQSTRLAWSVNGEPHASSRWSLQPGTHVVRVSSPSGASVEARIVVRDAAQ